jgi:hypothetical protein
VSAELDVQADINDGRHDGPTRNKNRPSFTRRQAPKRAERRANSAADKTPYMIRKSRRQHAGVKTAASRSVEILSGSALDDDDVDPRQGQLARQHQPGRPSPSITTACSVIDATHPVHDSWLLRYRP